MSWSPWMTTVTLAIPLGVFIFAAIGPEGLRKIFKKLKGDKDN